jgi:hypothetical protein
MDSNRVFAGMELSAGGRKCSTAALTSRLDVLFVKASAAEEWALELASFGELSIAVSGPLRAHSPSAEGTARSGDARRRGKWKGARSAEVEIRRRGIPIRLTPAGEDAAPALLRASWRLARELRQRGFQEEGGRRLSPRLLIETRPAACAAVLLGRIPFKRETLEGRIQRQLLLFREKVAVPDPMDSLEELTAHHLLSGRLALRGIRTPEELDALLAAYTAWRAACLPDSVTWLGRGRNGQICLPVKELLNIYLKSDYSPAS